MAQNYLGDHMSGMDRNYYQQLDTYGTVYDPLVIASDKGGQTTMLGPMELGQSANPFQNQLLSLQARIRAGASSVELSFSGAGKGSQQQSTPEMYGAEEREAMRSLAEFNEMKVSTHASFGVSGLAGFGRDSFDRQAQHGTMEEVRKAVDFAAQATTGGAIVLHTGEWVRPISEAPWATQDFKKDFQDKPAFVGYSGEQDKAFLPVVDKKTGKIISGISKDEVVYEPVWTTAKKFKKDHGRLPGVDMKGNQVEYNDDDFVDIEGRRIDPKDPEQLFRRVPEWDDEKTAFKTEPLDWKKIVEKTEQYNKEHPDEKKRPEELFAEIQMDNEVLQSRGSSLFYAKDYQEWKARYDRHRNQLIRLVKADNNRDEKGVKDILDEFNSGREEKEKINDPRQMAAILNNALEQEERHMRHVHEASSAADVRASTLEARKGRLEPMEKYGLGETGRALGELGMYALQKSKQMKENAKEKGSDPSKYQDIYIAPENVFAQQYGSHPTELIKIVEEGRKKMAEELISKNMAKTKEEAAEIAAKHIKSTIDIGHLNTWKTHMVRKDNESEVDFNKRFEKWMLGYLEEMHKKGILGHFHITDNMGFQDEHLTPGQGNAPIRSFVKKLEEWGYKDFIIEQSGMNDANIMAETWSYLGAQAFKPQYGQPGGSNFSEMHWRHAGAYAPPNFIFGSYVPSNEWTFWSGLPLE